MEVDPKDRRGETTRTASGLSVITLRPVCIEAILLEKHVPVMKDSETPSLPSVGERGWTVRMSADSLGREAPKFGRETVEPRFACQSYACAIQE